MQSIVSRGDLRLNKCHLTKKRTKYCIKYLMGHYCWLSSRSSLLFQTQFIQSFCVFQLKERNRTCQMHLPNIYMASHVWQQCINKQSPVITLSGTQNRLQLGLELPKIEYLSTKLVRTEMGLKCRFDHDFLGAWQLYRAILAVLFVSYNNIMQCG